LQLRVHDDSSRVTCHAASSYDSASNAAFVLPLRNLGRVVQDTGEPELHGHSIFRLGAKLSANIQPSQWFGSYCVPQGPLDTFRRNGRRRTVVSATSKRSHEVCTCSNLLLTQPELSGQNSTQLGCKVVLRLQDFEFSVENSLWSGSWFSGLEMH